MLPVFGLHARSAVAQGAPAAAKPGLSAPALLARVKAKLDRVQDYTADARLRLDVSFLKVPESEVTVYYKSPDKLRVHQSQGISILPKGGIGVSLSALLAGSNYSIIDAGLDAGLRVVKLVPLAATPGGIVLTTLYIDPGVSLIRKMVATTADNGTYEMDLEYGRYADWALPDRVVFVFSTNGFALPKGVTLEYDPSNSGTQPTAHPTQGKVYLTYERYRINQGLPADAFK